MVRPQECAHKILSSQHVSRERKNPFAEEIGYYGEEWARERPQTASPAQPLKESREGAARVDH